MSTGNLTVVTPISTETSTIRTTSTTTTTSLIETTTTTSPTSTTTSIPTSTTTTSPPPDPLISTPTTTPILTPITSTTPTVIGVTKITTIGVTEITTINGTPATVIITITSTNLPASSTPTSESSSATTSTGAVQTGGTNASGGGLSGGALVAVAVIIPVVILAVVVVGLVLYFKRRKSNRNVPIKAPVAGGIIGGSGPPPISDRDGVYELNDTRDGVYELNDTDSAGYRGWGSTVRNPKSTVSGSPGYPISSVVSDSGYSNPASVGPPGYISELYGGGVNAPASPVFPDSAGLLSADRTAPSPAFTESSTIGAMPTFDSHNGGLNRGVSNASSNYSAMTHSDQSDFDQRQSQQYYGPDAQDYDAAYFSNGPNMYYDDTSNPPPVIRDVQARRNTRIETPTSPHFPQHGSSGIAQNF